jgi:transcriptional regulator with XRE-family HTH domain
MMHFICNLPQIAEPCWQCAQSAGEIVSFLRKSLRNMRRLRAARGLSQEALAHDCGINRTYLSSVERSERNVSIDNIARIARGLRVERGGCSGTTEPGAPIRFRARRPLSKQVPPWRSEKLAARFDPKPPPRLTRP